MIDSVSRDSLLKASGIASGIKITCWYMAAVTFALIPLESICHLWGFVDHNMFIRLLINNVVWMAVFIVGNQFAKQLEKCVNGVLEDS